MAYRAYKTDLEFNPDSARIRFQDDYLIRNLLNQHEHAEASGSSIIDFIEPFSPVDELVKSSKVVRTGKGGVPSKDAFRKSHRNIHKSYIGNIAANSTTESADVGLVNYHTMGAFISKDTGMYGNKIKLDDDTSYWDTVSIDEALVPFQNSMDSDRLILARTHMGQKIPILNGELPLIQSGAEFIVPQLTSSKFAHRASKNGEILKVEDDKFIHVKYDDGSIEILDIVPRYSSTKRSSTIRISLDTLKPGDKFKTGELIAWSKSFKDGGLAIGKNKKVAVLNYMGLSHEDGYTVTENMANDFQSELVLKIPVIIPPNTKVLTLNKNKNTKLNEPLIIFQHEKLEINDSDDYLANFDLIDSEFQDDIEQLYTTNENSIVIKSPGGEIVDIKVKLNTKTHLDPVILNEWEEQNTKIKSIQKALSKNNTKHKLSDNIDTSIIKIGNHKIKGNEYEGALIEFYINTINSAKIGNKIANRFGAKGVINHIIKKDNIPYGEYSGDIDYFLAPAAILGRKNTVILKELYLGKIIYNLKSIIKNIYDTNGFDKAKNAIMYVYTTLDEKSNQLDTISSLKETTFKTKINDPNFNFNYIIPPFKTVSFNNIKKVAKYLKIPLDEKVYIKELDTWTKTPVPVGYSYISTMEQLSGDYESTRSKAGYSALTGQPLKRKIKMGGQSLGNLDVYNLLTYDCNSMMSELMTVRSDNIKAKNEVLNNIMQNGSSNLPTEIKQGKTQDLFKMMMLSLGLNVKGKF